MNAFFILSLILVIGYVSGFRVPVASFGYRVCRIPYSSASVLHARPQVGEVVVAKVDDIGGSFKEPMVFLDINRDGEVLKGRLPSRLLSPQERLAIQSGSVLRVAITGEDRDGYIATLPGQRSLVVERTADFHRPPRERRFSNKPAAPTEPPGVLINNLKTGMKFEGTVMHVTPYAAFVDAKIFRHAKGGVFLPANGFLSKHDMSEEILSTEPGRNNKAFSLEKGDEVTVYVKEVFKNAGRFTWTMDPTIKKETIIEQKRQTQEEGRERRQARRMRRQLDTLLAGDSISGVVDKVTSEGVLVTISSLGPMNVTALINVRDMPKQFEVPGDLASSFQVEILEQDFYPGREVRCSVLKIHPNPSPSKKYNIKLLFDEFIGKSRYDEVEVTDRGVTLDLPDLQKLKGKRISENTQEEDDEDYDEDEYDEDGNDQEVTEIFNELRGNHEYVDVDKFLAWEDMQEMVEEGNISKNDILDMIRSAGVKGKQMNLEAFEKVIEMVQDHLDDQEFANEEEEVDGFEDNNNDKQASSKTVVVSKEADKEDQGEEAFEDDEDDEEEEEEEEEEGVAEIYNDLKGSDPLLSASSLKNWSEIKELIKSKQISAMKIEQMLKDLQVDLKKGLSLAQFRSFVDAIDEAIMLEDGVDAPRDEEREVKRPAGKVETKTAAPVVTKDKEETVDNDDEDYEDEDDDEFFQEIYDSLKNKDGVVTIDAFKLWEDVRSMLAEGDVTEAQLNSIIEDVVGFNVAQKKSKKTGAVSSTSSKLILSFDQFKEILEVLDEELMSSAEPEGGSDSDVYEDEQEDEKSSSSQDQRTTEEREEDVVVDDAELSREIFDELSADSKVVKVKDLRQWDEMTQLFDQGYLDKGSFEALLIEVGAKPNGSLDFEQFSQLLRLIDETTQAMMSTVDPKDNLLVDHEDRPNAVMAESPDDEYVDDEDEEEEDEGAEDAGGRGTVSEAIAMAIFDDLRGKAGKLTISKLHDWDLLQDMLSREAISRDAIDELVQDITGQSAPKSLNFEQFRILIDLLDEANAVAARKKRTADESLEDDAEDNDSEEDDAFLDEQTSREFFNALKGKNGKVSIDRIKSWDMLEDDLKAGSLTLNDIDEAAKAVGFNPSSQLTLPEFIQVLGEIGQRVQGLDEDEDYDEDYDEEDEDNNDNAVKEDLAKQQKEAALKAAYSSKSRADSTTQLPSGTGFGRHSEAEIKEGKARAKAAKQLAAGTPAPPAMPTGNNQLRIKQVTQEIFDDLRGKHAEIPLEAFRKWDELNNMFDNGRLKRTTLERTLRKVGVLDHGRINLSQFEQILTVLLEVLDIKDLQMNSKMLFEEDGEDSNADIEQDQEQAAKEVFHDLCGPKRKVLPLSDFFKWDDIQSLIKRGALTQEGLMAAVQRTGVDVSTPEACRLNFTKFCELLESIDESVDQSKMGGDDDDEEELPNADEVAGSKFEAEEGNDEDDYDEDEDDYDEDEDDYGDDEEEVQEMFAEISKGKEYITEKDLRGWKELKEMIGSNMIQQSTVDKYISTLEINKGRIDFDNFHKFVTLLDGSLIEEDPELSELFDQMSKFDQKN